MAKQSGSHPFLSKAATSSTLMPKMNRFSSPASSAISTLAPSIVPMVRAPLSMNFMLPVPEASVPAVEICSDRSVAGMTVSRPCQYDILFLWALSVSTDLAGLLLTSRPCAYPGPPSVVQKDRAHLLLGPGSYCALMYLCAYHSFLVYQL